MLDPRLTISRYGIAAALALGLFGPACPGPRVGGDAGPAAAPGDRVFSIGISNHAGGPPQSAPLVNLRFRGGVPAADTVAAARVSTPPAVDGEAGDWDEIPASSIALQGAAAAVGMTPADFEREYRAAVGYAPPADQGLSAVAVKAAYDDQHLYLLLQWADSTEDRRRDEWYRDGGTFVRSRQNEDRAYLAFEIGESSPAFRETGCASACHVKERLGQTSAADRTYRFRMHTTAPGERVDAWTWAATRTNPMRAAGDGVWDSVGRQNDQGADDFTLANRSPADAGFDAPLFMAAGGVNAPADYLFLEGAGSPVAVPFDGNGASPPARVPGFVHRFASARRADVTAQGHWSAGTWTLELSRALITPDEDDAQFPAQ